MTRFASYLSLVLGAAVALQHAACGFDVASPSELSGTAGSNRYAVLASSPSNGAASHLADMQEQVTVVDLTNARATSRSGTSRSSSTSGAGARSRA